MAVATQIAMYPKTCMHEIGLILLYIQQSYTYVIIIQNCIQNIKLAKCLNSYMLMFSKVL